MAASLSRLTKDSAHDFLFEKGKTDRNTYISGSSLLVCLAVQSVCLRMICRGPLCVLKDQVCIINSENLL